MRRIIAAGLGLGFIVAIGLTPDRAYSEPKGKSIITIGRVSDKPHKHYKELRPIVDYMASKMGDIGIEKGEVVIFKDNDELIQALKEGKVDWVSESPFSAIIYEEEAGAEIIARRWKKMVPDYYCVFFTRKDSGIDSLVDLKGKKVAFEDPGSTTAYFVPKATLKKEGLQLVELATAKEKPPADKVGYAFAGGELNISTWVVKGLSDAGAFSNLDWEDPGNTPEPFKKDLKIIYKTKSFPRAVELVRGDLDPKIKERIKKVLFKAHKDQQAKDPLAAYDKTSKFDAIKGKVKEGLDEVRRILGEIR